MRLDLGMQPELEYTDKNRLTWWGRLHSVQDTSQTKTIKDAQIRIKSTRGRSRETKNNITQTFQKTGEKIRIKKILARNKEH